jgi:hypothetical protein
MRNIRLMVALMVCLVVTASAHAVINPTLQPSHLADRYLNVLSCRVAAVDTRALTVVLAVQGVSKGDFTAKEIVMSIGDKSLADAILTLQKGQTIVAYAGKTRRRHEGDILYYVGGGVWYTATMADGEDKWTVLANADAGKDPSSSEIMFGTFNGEPESLWEMMQDTARNTAYFPAVPLARFSAKTVVSLDPPVRGVAIYDVNGDGRPDLLGCSSGGNRLLIQDEKGAFADRTEVLGLAGTKSAGCSFADADGDGDADLLLDGVLYRLADGKFTKSSDIPVLGECLSAAFVEYNGDGYPDIVISRAEAGLSLYVNPGVRGGPFEDGTEAAGLGDQATGQVGGFDDFGGEGGGATTGYFEACDWDLDGRTDLIYTAGGGCLLWQNPDGVFEPSNMGGQEHGSEIGTAAFGTIVRPDRPSAYLVAGDNKMLICDRGGTLVDVQGSGNEIQDPVPGLLMAVAEDLNADGTVDLYAASQLRGVSSFFVANRGYGSFMLSEKYRGGKVFPPTVYSRAAWGLATGDVNGDGAVDMLVGQLDGTLSLLVNETLVDRPEQAEISTINDVRKQIQTRIVTVRPTAAKGMVGCRLTLLDETGKPVTHRWTGTNIGVGCCGPAQFTLAVREPGSYTLQVRLGDGSVQRLPLIIKKETARHQVLTLR